MNIEPQGFCDTNIFVDFSLTDKFLNFIDKFKKLNIADAVHTELLDWSRDNYDYSYIYNNLIEQIEKENILLIEFKKFSPLQKEIIERRLEGINELLENFSQEKKKHLNKGEIVSAVYAEVTNAPFIQSNDKFPGELKNSEFKNIIFLDRRDILKELCVSFKEVEHYDREINREREKMNVSFKKSKEVEKSKLPIDDNKKNDLLEFKEELKKKNSNN